MPLPRLVLCLLLLSSGLGFAQAEKSPGTGAILPSVWLSDRFGATLAGAGAQQLQGVRRLVCITGAMIGHPPRRLGWLYQVMRTAYRDTLQDRQRQERPAARAPRG